jgi:hypothetical protein
MTLYLILQKTHSFLFNLEQSNLDQWFLEFYLYVGEIISSLKEKGLWLKRVKLIGAWLAWHMFLS